MRLIVIAKHVPDSKVAVRVKPDGSGLETGGLKYVCDPFDEIGIEQAVALKKARSDIEEVVALTAGPAGAVDALRHALAMGADRAVHVVAEDLAHHDELRASALYAGAIRQLGGFGLVLCGARNTDSGAGELGPALAERLGVPHAGAVTSIEIDDAGSSLVARSRVEGGELVVEASLPAVISCERGLIEPSHPALPKLMKAKKAPVETIDANTLDAGGGAGAVMSALTPPKSRPACKMLEGDPPTMAKELARLLREEARVV